MTEEEDGVITVDYLKDQLRRKPIHSEAEEWMSRLNVED